MDEEGEIAIPVTNGLHLKENYVGKNIEKYDSMLVLSHFKGHPMGGYGGALKQLSIELNVPIIITSQLSCSVNEKENRIPTLEDFNTTTYCRYCGSTIKSDSKFCKRCGKKQ